MRRVLWTTMAVVCLLIAIYAAGLLLIPSAGPPFLAQRRATMPLAVVLHLAGGLWALAVGPWQLNQRLRERALPRHRWLGRTYVVGVLIGSLGALLLAPFAETGVVASLGFASLGALWLCTTMMAFVRIRQGDRVRHRRWMIRSFALTLAAVTLRVYLPLSFVAGIPFETAYPAIAWLCWAPNLVAAELLLARRSRDVALAA